MTPESENLKPEERASWKRRRQEEQRARKQRGEHEPSDPDWSDPAVLRAYGGGQPNGIGPELLSPRLMDKLRQHTQPRQNEFGALIDRVTADVMQMVEGTKGRVQFDRNIFDSIEDVAPVHTHDEDIAFSDADWDSFVNAHNVNIEMLVTPDAVYILRKTREFDPAPLGQKDPDEYWRERLEELTQSSEFRARFATKTAMQRAAVEIINREMADLFGVHLERRGF